MEKLVVFKLSIKKDFSSDLIEELRHIDKYLSKYINANLELIVTELSESSKENFTVELNNKKIENPTIATIVDIANNEVNNN